MYLSDYTKQYLNTFAYQYYKNNNLDQKIEVSATITKDSKDILCFLQGTKKICIRLAHSTPAKAGQFVTLYKRAKNSHIVPLNIFEIDYLLVVYMDRCSHGIFIIDQNTLLMHDIISDQRDNNTRADVKLSFRIYHPDCVLSSKISVKSQAWQRITYHDFPDCMYNIQQIL